MTCFSIDTALKHFLTLFFHMDSQASSWIHFHPSLQEATQLLC